MFNNQFVHFLQMPPLPEKLYGVENGVWRDPATRPRWANIGVIVGQFNTLKALLDGWREKDYDWAKWINEQAQFNRALAKNETTVDYHGQIVWNGGADLDSFKAVAVTEPVSGIESHIPYGPLLPKLGMSAATGQIPVILHMNMGYGEVKKDAWTEDQAVDKVLEQLWWSSGREEAFKKIALRELHARRIFIGANDRIGQDYDELCGAYREFDEPAKRSSKSADDTRPKTALQHSIMSPNRACIFALPKPT